MRSWKIIASLSAIFVLGGLSGAAITSALKPHRAEAIENKWAGRTLEEYRERLKLTPGQIAKLRPEFEKTGAELRSVRQETVEKLRAIIKANSSLVMRELTPNQRETFKQLLEERRAHVEAGHYIRSEPTP